MSTETSTYRSKAVVKSRDEPTTRREYLYVALRGGASQARPLSEVVDELRAKGVTDLSTVTMWGSFWWERPETDEERAQREESDRKRQERHEAWERETYARLREKYGDA